MTIIGIAKLSSKHQITVPRDVRKILKVEAGDKVVFRNENEKITIEKA